MIEILVVVGIIALLVGLLIPAVSMVQKAAREVKQKAQFTAIDVGLAAFRNDYGDYPPSDWWSPSAPAGPQNYCGAQKLAEAMLGWDLLGFHPNSAWRADGYDAWGGPETYDPDGVYKKDPLVYQENLKKRRDRYIEIDTANAFRISQTVTPGLIDGLFVTALPLAPAYVLCDVFEVPERKLQLSDGKTVSPGTPILYYKANSTSKLFNHATSNPDYRIYNYRDNAPLIDLGRLADWAKAPADRWQHPIKASLPTSDPYFPGEYSFYEFIRDPKVTTVDAPWPYRPDSYILISAGADGLYGTADDIRNFGRR
jgi:type II secretory pathway pseudopilin PulG